MPILSHQTLTKIIRGKEPFIRGVLPITDDQIQMASVDLTLGTRVYGMRASALPREGKSIQSLIDEQKKSNYAFELDTKQDKFLHRGQTYIAPLNESLELPQHFSAKFSPKSSIGRIDVFVRVLADGIPRFDHVPDQYRGPLYLEITPLSCDILVRAGQPLVQMRIKYGDAGLSAMQLAVRQSHEGIVWNKNGKVIPVHSLKTQGNGILMHVDLDREVVGFVARNPMMTEISLAAKNAIDPSTCWDPIFRPSDGAITLLPWCFYLLATKERIKVPVDICGDIPPYDQSAGEFRSHYAGFFDPGFGGHSKEDTGTVGVMEVRGREIPFRLEDNQPICRMEFEELDEVPTKLYGEKNNYTGVGASLSKFFKDRQSIWKE